MEITVTTVDLLPVMLINHRTQQCFLVLVFIVHLHYMFRPLIGGHLQVICDKYILR
jgi:hypothetical protein